MKVYVITEGEYSGYHIVGVTLDKDAANEYVEKHSSEYAWTSFRVEEYDTDIIQMIHEGMKLFHVWSRDGVIGVNEGDNDSYAYWTDEINDVTHSKKHKWYSVYVIAKDKEHAEKQGIDLFTKYKYRHKIEEAT